MADDPIVFTDWAVRILQRSSEAARRFNPDARLRASRQGDGVRLELTDRAEPGDREVQGDGFVLLVAEGLAGTVDVIEPHDQLILREPG